MPDLLAPEDLLSLGFLNTFQKLKEPRLSRRRLHELFDILCIALLSFLSGGDTFVQMEAYGHAQKDWLSQFLSLKHGIPSHDTFGRVFAALDPDAFASCLMELVQTLAAKAGLSSTVALDGKSVRGTFDKAKKKSSLHLVSVFATQTHLLLGQVKTEEKSNEIPAMRQALDLVELKGSCVTLDAMGCQTEIAKRIMEKEGDYVLSVKGNQGTLLDDLQHQFRNEDRRKHKQAKTATEVEKGHGRIETRTARVLPCPAAFPQATRFVGLQSLVELTSQRDLGTKVTSEKRYFITSLPLDPTLLLARVRSHWGIENTLHWVLDVAFSEDACQVRVGHAAHNLATLRRIALMLLKQETSSKGGIKTKRTQAAWSKDYLLKVLQI